MAPSQAPGVGVDESVDVSSRALALSTDCRRLRRSPVGSPFGCALLVRSCVRSAWLPQPRAARKPAVPP